MAEADSSRPFQVSTNTMILVIAIIGGTIAMDSRYIDTVEADSRFHSKVDAEKFMRSVQELHTQQTATLLELRARELNRLHTNTSDMDLKREIQGEIDTTSERMTMLSKRFNRFYEDSAAYVGG